MSVEAKPAFTLNHSFVVLSPEQEKAYPISISDWTFIKGKVQGIIPQSKLFNTLGSIAAGIAISSIFAVISLQKTITQLDKTVLIFCWMLFALTGILAGVFYFVDIKVFGDKASVSKSDIIAEMKRLEDKFKEKEQTLAEILPDPNGVGKKI